MTIWSALGLTVLFVLCSFAVVKLRELRGDDALPLTDERRYDIAMRDQRARLEA